MKNTYQKIREDIDRQEKCFEIAFALIVTILLIIGHYFGGAL